MSGIKIGELPRRLLVGFSLTVPLLWLCFSSTFEAKCLFVAVMAVMASVGSWECLCLLQGHRKPAKTVFFSAGLIVASFLVSPFLLGNDLLPWLLFFFSLLLNFLYHFKNTVEAKQAVPIFCFSLSYLTIPALLLLNIRYMFADDRLGAFFCFYTIFITKVTDVGAYAVGKSIGKHALAKHISPNKTIEGALGGIVVAILMSLYFAPHVASWSNLALPWSAPMAIGLGLAIAVLGQLGDLAESLLKRSGEKKDSNKLPGLGGVLDLTDSLIFTVPLVYFFLATTSR